MTPSIELLDNRFRQPTTLPASLLARFICTSRFLLLLVLLLSMAVPLAADENSKRTQANFRCRIVNATIPVDSPLRHATNINHPPNLYVVIKKDGLQLGKTSTAVTGWTVDFPKGNSRNEWEISTNEEDRYSVELWDDNWGSDDLALSVTGISAQALRGVIHEQGGKALAKDRLVTFTFAEVNDLATQSANTLETANK